MSGTLHLTIATPEAAVVDDPAVQALRAQDESGAFGILPGHADLLTVLPPSVVRWRGADGAARFCAVRGGVLTVRAGREVAIAAREAHLGDAIETLEAGIAATRAQEADEARRAGVDAARLHAAAVRQLMVYLARDPAAHGDLLSGGAQP